MSLMTVKYNDIDRCTNWPSICFYTVSCLFYYCGTQLDKSNTTGATSGAETAFPSVTSFKFTPFFMWNLCCSIYSFLRSVLKIIVLSVLLSFGHCVVCSSVFWPLCCLFFCLVAIVLSVLLPFGHCVVCSSSIYNFWLHLWYLQTLLDIELLRRKLFY